MERDALTDIFAVRDLRTGGGGEDVRLWNAGASAWGVLGLLFAVSSVCGVWGGRTRAEDDKGTGEGRRKQQAPADDGTDDAGFGPRRRAARQRWHRWAQGLEEFGEQQHGRLHDASGS